VIARFGLLAAWAALIALFGLLKPGEFLTAGTAASVLSSQAVLLILALGLIPTLTAGILDLSAPALLGLADTLVGELGAVRHWPLGPTAAAVLAVALLVGGINALLIVGIGIDPIVVTLGMSTLLAGAALGVNIVPTAGISPWLVDATRHQILGVQAVFYLALLLALATWYFQTHTPAGRQLYFVGAGPEVARLAGIAVRRYRATALIYGSVTASAAGILLAGTLGSSDPTIGPTYLLPAFAAVYLGASAITPGRFNAWGTVIAVYFLTTGVTGLELVGVSGWINQVFYGISLVAAALVSALLTRDRAIRNV
jgi:ribose transport system permease protein